MHKIVADFPGSRSPNGDQLFDLEIEFQISAYAQWVKTNNFAFPTDQSGPEADPDRDGYRNMVELAMGTDPLKPTVDDLSNPYMPRLVRTESGWFYQVEVNPATRDGANQLQVSLEVSEDLRRWKNYWSTTRIPVVENDHRAKWYRLRVTMQE